MTIPAMLDVEVPLVLRHTFVYDFKNIEYNFHVYNLFNIRVLFIAVSSNTRETLAYRCLTKETKVKLLKS